MHNAMSAMSHILLPSYRNIAWILKVFGGSGTGPGQFWDPAGLAVDDVGNMLVADSRNHRLQLIGQDRKWIRNVKVIILILI